jgi:protein-S-isoprenylcysteine O-methyltransferase Ste14
MMKAPEETPNHITVAMIVRVVILFLVFLLLPFPIAGRWDWWGAWANGLLLIVSFIISRLIVARLHPDLLVERGRFMAHADIKPWDKVLSLLVGLVGGVLTIIVAGLNFRFGWQPAVSLPVILIGLGGVILGDFLTNWAVVANRFFSGVVRIQKERGHVVVDGGPYRLVRHPGYLGGAISDLAGALLLGSYWALIPALLTAMALVLRTALEDRTLQEELPGYKEYTRRTPYRLLPGVW